MPLQVSRVPLDEQVAQSLPCKNVEPVLSIVFNLDEDDDKTPHWTSHRLTDDLAFAVKRNVTELPDVSELPRCTPAGFHLDGNVSTDFVGRDDVVMRYVAGECGGDQPAARKLRRDEVLTSLPNDLIAAPVCHVSFVP